MITLQRRIFSLTAASPSGGAVIFVLSLYFRHSIFTYFHYSYPSPPSFPPSYIFIYYIPRRLLTVIYFHLISSPPPLDRHIYFRIIIFPARSRPSHISILLYPLPPLPPPRRWIQFFLVFILYGRPCTPMCGGRSVCGRENFSVSVLHNAFRARSLDVFGMLGDPVPRVVKGGRQDRKYCNAAREPRAAAEGGWM